MKLPFTFILLILLNACFAQKNDSIENKIAIKTNPDTYFDLFGGASYGLAIECKLYKNIAGSIEYGRYYNLNFSSLINPVGYIIRPEIKYYLNNHKRTSGGFLSLELMHKEISFDYVDSFKIGNSPAYQKQYGISKNVSCITIKCGELKVYQSGFILEWYIGGGIRFSNGHNTLTTDENNGILTGENHGADIGAAQRSFNEILPNLSLGFEIGYRLK